MRHSTERILTTHVGALPAPDGIWGNSDLGTEALAAAVRDVMARQRECGIDIINEGEFTKGGNWVSFVNSRLGGFSPVNTGELMQLMTGSADWREFSD